MLASLWLFKFTGTLRYGVIQDIYVVIGVKKALLGCPAIEALSLVSRINSLETPGNQFIAAYLELFQGRLGTMKGEYCIKLRPGAQPFSQKNSLTTAAESKSRA